MCVLIVKYSSSRKVKIDVWKASMGKGMPCNENSQKENQKLLKVYKFIINGFQRSAFREIGSPGSLGDLLRVLEGVT